MRSRLWTVLGTLCLLGCGKAPQDPRTGTQASGAAKPKPLAELRSLAPGQRSAVLFRAINASDQPCNSVTASVYQQDYQTMAMFVARCSGTAPYAVFVGSAGYAQVRACAILGKDVPACRIDALDHSDPIEADGPVPPRR